MSIADSTWHRNANLCRAFLRDQPLGCLVVVVGNLTVGGTGKTPVVEKFAKALHDRGRKVAILSRGYKSKAPPLWQKWWFWLNHTEEAPPRVVSDGRTVLLDSELAGDERQQRDTDHEELDERLGSDSR